MRLLNAKTLQIEEFFDKIPSYAILSHTWGEEELAFEDWGRPGFQEKKGYQKIRYLCEQTLKDGLKYAWCDTCNIDKRSSAELSEAINSMFRWYSNSSICYVYLEDVHDKLPSVFTNWKTSTRDGAYNILNDYHSRHSVYSQNEEQSLLHSEFANSRWFTRGWTLQELIAPRKVLFFSSSWVFLSSKTSIFKPLNLITGIDEDVLVGATNLKLKCVARKLSWAAHRTTTRTEDIAYCLMGLFDIHMPLLYGEGKHAFIRLQEEIIKNSNDHSVFAWEDEPGFLNDGLLAYHPKLFANCRSVVNTIDQNTSYQSYRITNAGLEIKLPLLKVSDKLYHPWLSIPIWVAILSCRYEDDFSGQLRIHLRSIDDESVQVFTRDVLLDATKDKVIESEEVVRATNQTLQVLRNGIGSFRPRPEYRFWLKVEANVDFLFEFFPQHHWNTDNGTMWIPYIDEPRGAIRLKRSVLMPDIVVIFGIAIMKIDGSQYTVPKSWIVITHGTLGRSLKQIAEESSLAFVHDSVSSKARPFDVHASIERVNIMGSDVHRHWT